MMMTMTKLNMTITKTTNTTMTIWKNLKGLGFDV